MFGLKDCCYSATDNRNTCYPTNIHNLYETITSRHIYVRAAGNKLTIEMAIVVKGVIKYGFFYNETSVYKVANNEVEIRSQT